MRQLGLMQNGFRKVTLLGLVAVFVLAGIFVAAQYFTSDNYRQMREAKRLAEEIKREYANDPYGADTPEETLRLFVEALKKEDIDLAAKYFVIDKQEEWRKYLSGIKQGNLLNDMIKDLEMTQLTRRDHDAFVTLTDENGVVISEMIIQKNQLSKKWKIVDL